MDYEEFIKQKEIQTIQTGFDPIWIHEILFDFQKALTKWAIKKGRAAIWAGTGLGKSVMQLTWAENVHQYTGGSILILAPLGVTAQTKAEAEKMLGLDVKICSSGADVIEGLNITNYEKLHKFDPSSFTGVVLDESSCLKNFTAKTKQLLINMFGRTQYKLCCSATPSPNDYTEIGNHAEFLNICTRSEMLATYFVHDSGSTQKWRLKGHAENVFFKWISTWAVMIEKPSDIGFSDEITKLPKLNMFEHKVESNVFDGELFVSHAQTLTERRKARRNSLESRCQLAADINNASEEMFLNWCDLNDESSLLTKLIDGAVEVKGADKNEKKAENLLAFAKGDIKKLVTKPKIASMGLNLQLCHNMCFVGLSDSFEAFYQAVRRCYRFGQKKPVNVHVIISDKEGSVLQNIKRKEADAKKMLNEMVKFISINTISDLKSETTENHNNNVKFKMPKFI